jgi:hypothetical protein
MLKSTAHNQLDVGQFNLLEQFEIFIPNRPSN